MIPHLTASLTGPLQELEVRIPEINTSVKHWFRGHWQAPTRPGDGSTRFHSYGVTARLALAAAAIELERTAPAE